MYPGCSERMMNSEGVFIGQVCHIEAAEPGGERFNEKQTNEERRSFSNLMLMCYAHHQVTNDVVKYRVEVLREFKAAHERKFTDIAGTIERCFVKDVTAESSIRPAKKLSLIAKTLGWSLTDEELDQSAKELSAWAEKLRNLAPDTRRTFCIIVQRAGSRGQVPYREIRQVVNISTEELRDHIATLDRYRFIGEGDRDEFEDAQIRVLADRSGWEIALDLKTFVGVTKHSLERLLVELDFSVLD